jgi:uncharacterized protein (DUF849 family)
MWCAINEEGAMIVQACLNGARKRGFHEKLPLDGAALAEDGAAAVRAGANELHVHVRSADGARESLAPADVDATLAAIRLHLPGTLIGISTGAWIERDADRRLALIGEWRALPDHASVNLGEAGAPMVIERLRARGVHVEAGLASPQDAERLVELRLWRFALRILVEIEERDVDAAMSTADATIAVLRRAGVAKPILLHGTDTTVWPLLERAFRDGFSTRVGLEDGATLPDGTRAESNAALVREARRIYASG